MSALLHGEKVKAGKQANKHRVKSTGQRASKLTSPEHNAHNMGVAQYGHIGEAAHLDELGHLPFISLSDFLDSHWLNSLSKSLVDLCRGHEQG